MHPPARLRDHAHQLAQRINARLVECDMQPDEACAVPMLRTAMVHRIIDETTYAVALHELGHLGSALGSIPRDAIGDVVMAHRIEEHAAWEWARHNALDWSDVMESVRRWAEDTYAAAPAATPQTAAPSKPKQEINWNDWR